MKKSKTIAIATLSLILVVCLICYVLIKDESDRKAEENIQDYNKIFELTLSSDKQIYKTTDKIMIWADLKYVGKCSSITIWHGDPGINFTISDGKEFHTGGFVHTILTSTTLEKNKLYRYQYSKNGGFSPDDPSAEFWKKFYSEKDLFLPEGEFEIEVTGGFSLSETGRYNGNLSKQMIIKVEN